MKLEGRHRPPGATLLRAFVFVALGAACGGPGTAQGTVAGNALKVVDAAFTGGNEVVLSDQTNLCQRLKDNQQGKGETTLVLHFTRSVGSMTQAPDVGDYQVVRSVTVAMGDGRFATAGFFKLDESCQNTVGFTKGTAVGTVALQTAESGQHARGTFDLSFGDTGTPERLTGSFDAADCQLPTSLPDRTCP